MADDYRTARYKLSHRLQGVVNGLSEDIAKTLEGSLDIVSGRLISLELEADKTASYTRRKAYLSKQKTEIEKVLSSVYSDIGENIESKAVELAKASPEIGDTILKQSAGDITIKMSVPALAKKRIMAWWESSQVDGLFFNDWVKKLQGNAAARIVKEAREGMVLSESTKQIGKRIQKALDVSKHSANGLAHNAVHQAYNWGERQYFIENRERIRGLRYVAELDRQTCPLCIPLDQKVFKIDACPMPPIHWRCRCHVEPVMENQALEKALGEQTRIARLDTEARTIKHRDGTTSTTYDKLDVRFPKRKLTYSQWMQSMVKSRNAVDVDFARESLGKMRFDMVRSGKLTVSKLYYGGKLRTIDQLKEIMK